MLLSEHLFYINVISLNKIEHNPLRGAEKQETGMFREGVPGVQGVQVRKGCPRYTGTYKVSQVYRVYRYVKGVQVRTGCPRCTGCTRTSRVSQVYRVYRYV